MFGPTSRYFALENAAVTLPDGRTATYKRRRFAPAVDSLAQLTEVVVAQDDRIDVITATTLGDPEQFWRICDANIAMAPEELTDEVGRGLRITLPEGIPGQPNA